MRFVHIADMHFDAPFTVLNTKKLGEQRRLEQREALRKVITYIKENKIEYLFISGDLYENEYIRTTTIIYINNLFKEIPNTKIYITPGNHDPYINQSMYKNFEWNSNVKIFGSQIEIVENPEVDIYGFGFDDFYCRNSEVENIKIQNKDKINILITHGSLDVGYDTDREYNPMHKNKLKSLGLDYIALGHIHKLDYNQEENQRIVYPGSTISLGFDEMGKHGMIVGSVDKHEINLEFVPIDNKEFKEIAVDITQINSIEELIESINALEIDENTYYKIILTGKRNFEINTYHLHKFIVNDFIIKIKDETKINIDIYKIAEEINLRGLFLKEILQDKNNKIINENIAEKIIEIGLDVLK